MGMGSDQIKESGTMTPILLRHRDNPSRVYHGVLNEPGDRYQYGSPDGLIARILEGKEKPDFPEDIAYFNSMQWEIIRLTRID